MAAPFVHLLLVLVVSIVAHEAAHAAAARAVGHELFEIQIGAGPITSFRLGSVDVRLGPVPLGGSVQTGARTLDGFRWRAAVVAGAGAGANLILAVAGLALGSAPMVAFNVIAVAANLWPGRRSALGVSASDGRVLLDLSRNDHDAIAEEQSGWWSAQAMRLHDADDIDGAVAVNEEGIDIVGPTRALLAIRGVLAFTQQRFDDAVAAYAELIDDERVSVTSRAGFAADAAFAAGLADDDRWRSVALPWAALARAAAPRDRRRRLIHGLALAHTGDVDATLEAIDGLDDAQAHGVAVIAFAAAGDRVAATERYRVQVEGRLDADHPLTRRVRAALDPAT